MRWTDEGSPEPRQDLVGPKYWSDPYYKTPEFAAKLRAAQEVERVRQYFVAKKRTPETIAYGRFLMAVESDATCGNGQFGRFEAPSDEDLFREFPFLDPEGPVE